MHAGSGLSVRTDEVVALIDLTRPQADSLRLIQNLRQAQALRPPRGGQAAKTLVLLTGGQGVLSGVGLRTLRQRLEQSPLNLLNQPDNNSEV